MISVFCFLKKLIGRPMILYLTRWFIIFLQSPNKLSISKCIIEIAAVNSQVAIYTSPTVPRHSCVVRIIMPSTESRKCLDINISTCINTHCLMCGFLASRIDEWILMIIIYWYKHRVQTSTVNTFTLLPMFLCWFFTCNYIETVYITLEQHINKILF